MSEIACLGELKNGKKWGGGEQKEEQKGEGIALAHNFVPFTCF